MGTSLQWDFPEGVKNFLAVIGAGAVLALICWLWFQWGRRVGREEAAPVQDAGSQPPIDVESRVVSEGPSHAPESTSLAVSAPQAEIVPFEHSADFRTVKCHGKALPLLTPDQSQVVQRAVELSKEGVLEFYQKDLLKGIGSAFHKRLRDTFKSNLEAFTALFTPVENRKGVFRFNFA